MEFKSWEELTKQITPEGYESPVTIFDDIAKQISEYKDGQIMTTINMYVDVNKEELIKALNYDRDQYNKGYKKGFIAAREIHHWEYESNEMCDTIYKCSKCNYHIGISYVTHKFPNFCENCGSIMRGEDNG